MGGSLLRKVAIWFTLFSIVPLLIFSSFTIFKIYENAQTQFDQNLQTLSHRLQGELNQRKKRSQDWIHRFKQDPRLALFVQGGEADEARNLLKNSDLSRHSRVRVFDNTGTLIAAYSSNSSFGGATLVNRDSSRHQIREFSNFLPNVGLVLTTKSVLLSRSRKSVGQIYVDTLIDLKELNGLSKDLQADLVIINEDGKPLYRSGGLFRVLSLKEFQKKKSSGPFQLVLEVGKGRALGSFAPASQGNETTLYFGVSLPQSLILDPLLEILVVLISVLLSILLFVGIFSYSMSRSLLSPFYYLTQQVQAFDGVRPIRSLTIKEPDIAKLAGAFQKMADRIQKMRTELEQKVRELEVANRESQMAQDQLLQSAKMASLGQLVAGVAHELNNPISFIQGNITPLREYSETLVQLIDGLAQNSKGADKLLEKHDFEYIKKDLPKLLNSFDEGTKRTRDIINGLRNFSRQEKAQYMEVDLAGLLEKAIKFVEPQLKTRITIHRQFTKTPKIWCVESQLVQVFVNIFTNAIQATKGEGNIWITTNPDGKGFGKQGGVRISVQDSGRGIREENVAKIFDPFFTTKEVGEGTGLGLSISYGIVRSHGGEIKVRSKLGVGTEFIISLPLKPPPLQES